MTQTVTPSLFKRLMYVKGPDTLTILVLSKLFSCYVNLLAGVKEISLF